MVSHSQPRAYRALVSGTTAYSVSLAACTNGYHVRQRLGGAGRQLDTTYASGPGKPTRHVALWRCAQVKRDMLAALAARLQPVVQPVVQPVAELLSLLLYWWEELAANYSNFNFPLRH